ALWTSWRQGRRWQQTLRELIIWGLVTTAVVLVVCPAIWANPPQTITTLSQGVTEEGGEPHQTGNYFLGKPAVVPGPLIYPVTLALRLTPWTLFGLGLLGLFWRRTHPEDRQFLGLAALFALLFTAEISIFPKQFDRYLMPIFPAVDILAAAGIWAAVDGLKWPRVRSTIVTGLALVAIANVAWWYPYNLIAFNQLFGGAKTGEWALRMGWGEGMQDVAAWLNRQPNITEVMTVSTTIATLRPYVRQDTSVIRLPSNSKLPEKTGYVVLYLRNWQDGEIIQPFKSFFDTQQPVYTLQLKGVVYARIYEVVPTPQHQLHTSFGADVLLRGYDLVQDADSIDLTLYWETHGAPSDMSLFLHMLGADGQRYAQIDLPSVSSVWEAGRHYSTRIQLPLSGDLPAGEYQLALGMYDPQSFARLPISGGTRVDPAAAGPDALLMTTVQR
ncbi:MAG: hypothetical protein HGA19_08830, partial [Oscillochloris sp.]|nr:hypothetical protein [Oscillochloris sp.]